jgi:hypothetical protein
MTVTDLAADDRADHGTRRRAEHVWSRMGRICHGSWLVGAALIDWIVDRHGPLDVYRPIDIDRPFHINGALDNHFALDVNRALDDYRSRPMAVVEPPVAVIAIPSPMIGQCRQSRGEQAACNECVEDSSVQHGRLLSRLRQQHAACEQLNGRAMWDVHIRSETKC